MVIAQNLFIFKFSTFFVNYDVHMITNKSTIWKRFCKLDCTKKKQRQIDSIRTGSDRAFKNAQIILEYKICVQVRVGFLNALHGTPGRNSDFTS